MQLLCGPQVPHAVQTRVMTSKQIQNYSQVYWFHYAYEVQGNILQHHVMYIII